MHILKYEVSFIEDAPPTSCEWWMYFALNKGSDGYAEFQITISNLNDESNDFVQCITVEDAKAMRDFLVCALADK